MYKGRMLLKGVETEIFFFKPNVIITICDNRIMLKQLLYDFATLTKVQCRTVNDDKLERGCIFMSHVLYNSTSIIYIN